MSCASCGSSIEDTAMKRPGVEAVDVNFATGATTIEYDSGKDSLAQIYDAVGAAGHEPD